MSKKQEIKRVVAKAEDKTVQITFTIPSGIIKSEEEKILSDLGRDMQIAGFRKGKAPIAKVKENVKQEEIIEKILTRVVLPALREALEKENIKPIIYPRFELLSAKENEDWEVRVTTCEMPEVELGDYKEEIRKELKTEKIWTPDKKGQEEKKQTQEEKEQKVIETLLKTSKVEIPSLLVSEEVESRLAQLLERIEKLGLSLERYLESIGKTAESLRKEYEDQTKQSLALELTLNKIASEEKLDVPDEEIEKVLEMTNSTTGEVPDEEKLSQQREIVRSVLLRRKALELLTSLV
jgi:trigger factor